MGDQENRLEDISRLLRELTIFAYLSCEVMSR